MAKKIDFLEVGPTLADKDKRYALARKVDVLDFGSFLGKSEAMQAIDFLEILPKPQKVQIKTALNNLNLNKEQRTKFMSDIKTLK